MIVHFIRVLCLVYIVIILEIEIALLYQDIIGQLLNPVFCTNPQKNGICYHNKSKIVVAMHLSKKIYETTTAVYTKCNIFYKMYVYRLVHAGPWMDIGELLIAYVRA